MREGDGFFYRGSSGHGERWRLAGAIALVIAAWGVGFFSGRMSAWVLPVAESNTAARLSAIEQALARFTAASPAAVPAAAPQPKAGQDAGAGAAEPAGAGTTETGGARQIHDPATRRDDGPAQPAAAEAATANKQPEAAPRATTGNVTVINPDWEKVRSGAGYRNEAADREPPRDERAYAECARRFRSFRESDGTYQPYGRSSRERCPMLR